MGSEAHAGVLLDEKSSLVALELHTHHVDSAQPKEASIIEMPTKVGGESSQREKNLWKRRSGLQVMERPKVSSEL